jgi:hypothetical protein
MSTIDILFYEVQEAPDEMLEEVLDFVRFLKAGRFAPSVSVPHPGMDEDEVVFDKPRTIADLANEQRAFLASISQPLIDIDLSSQE